MNKLILEDGSPNRLHRDHLNALLNSTTGPLRVASAYVTDRQFLTQGPQRDRRLLVSLLPMDVASGATSLETLGTLIKSGVVCRALPDRPRLHAKVYIFGASHAVVTSANLTGSAFDSNIEVGTEIEPGQVPRVTAWFDALWEIASPLSLEQLSELKSRTKSLRQEFVKLKAKAKANLKVPATGEQTAVLSDKLQDLFANAIRYFVCNTDRRHTQRTPTGGFAIEEEMHNRGYAAAWESFKFPGHMEQVQAGDAILMFAKGIGIIGIGQATGKCETLLPGDPDRIHNSANGGEEMEWRIPVQWLEWTDEAGAYRCKSPNFTFWNVTEPQYDSLREGVKSHFLSND